MSKIQSVIFRIQYNGISEEVSMPSGKKAPRKIQSEAHFFKLPVVNDSDIFNADMIGGENRCDRRNSACLVNDIAIDDKLFLYASERTVRMESR